MFCIMNHQTSGQAQGQRAEGPNQMAQAPSSRTFLHDPLPLHACLLSAFPHLLGGLEL